MYISVYHYIYLYYTAAAIHTETDSCSGVLERRFPDSGRTRTLFFLARDDFQEDLDSGNDADCDKAMWQEGVSSSHLPSLAAISKIPRSTLFLCFRRSVVGDLVVDVFFAEADGECGGECEWDRIRRRCFRLPSLDFDNISATAFSSSQKKGEA